MVRRAAGRHAPLARACRSRRACDGGANLMLILGLTGSIGMGKSTTAAFFRAEGIRVHDADAAVHALYRGAAASLIEAAFPGTVTDGVVDRTRLGAQVLGNAAALAKLEAIV